MDFWMFSFFPGYLKDGKFLSWVGPLGFVIMASLLIVAYRRSSGWTSRRNRAIFWLLVLYATYIPFVTWWESIEPRWFIVPNIFLAALTAVILSQWRPLSLVRIALPAGVLMLTAFNLATSAWPKHFRQSNPSKMAACVAGHLDREDLFLATEWNWADYLRQIHDRSVVSFIGEVSIASRDKKIAMEKIRTIAQERKRNGGDVYMTDIGSYPADYMQWFTEQTGITSEELRTYQGSPAFECLGSNFLRLD